MNFIWPLENFGITSEHVAVHIQIAKVSLLLDGNLCLRQSFHAKKL